jgi:hypothetical protein
MAQLEGVSFRDTFHQLRGTDPGGSSALLMTHGQSGRRHVVRALQAPHSRMLEALAAAGCSSSRRSVTDLTGTGKSRMMRCRNRTSLARPYYHRLISFTRQLCPSHGPVLRAVLTTS